MLLEELLVHLALDDHERGVDEGALEQLALEHPDQVLDARVLQQLLLHLLGEGLPNQQQLPVGCLVLRVRRVRCHHLQTVLDHLGALT